MSASATIKPLTEETLPIAIAQLAAIDPHLAGIAARLGPAPLWDREPGFATLVHIILEQQVSLASARAAFEKLTTAVGVLTPPRLLRCSDHELRTYGFSRQKAGYCRGLAQSIANGVLNLEALQDLSDAQARSRLIEIKGIGPWTADIYLLMALRRPDVWPTGDLALATAMQQVMSLTQRPDQHTQARLAEQWKPWRAVAARLLWQHYLSSDKK
jgi:DNA-3-methyladenine glycosylase II